MKDLPPRRSRPRFSLLNLLLMMTIAAMGVGLYRAEQRIDVVHARNKQLAEENLKHRNELGIFDITDAEKIHVIRAPTHNDQPTTYRLYLPPGRKYRVGYRANRVPKEGLPEIADYLPAFGGEYLMEPGGYLIRVKLNRSYAREPRKPLASANISFDIDPTGGQRFSSCSAGVGFSQEKTKWLNPNGDGFVYSTRGIGRELETHDPGEPLVLYRVRIQEAYELIGKDGKPIKWRTRNPQGPSDGFMAWIESIEDPDE